MIRNVERLVDDLNLSPNKPKKTPYFLAFLVCQKPLNSEDAGPRPLLQRSPSVAEAPVVRRKRGLSSVSFLSDAMDGQSWKEMFHIVELSSELYVRSDF